MTGRHRLPVVLYRALTGLLPPGLRDDREDMVQAFIELREGAGRRAYRWAVTLRSLVALVEVLAAEWLKLASVRRTAARNRQQGRGDMGIRNLRYALRTLWKAPAFSLTSILLVAVGVGAVTTIFTLVDHVLLRPLPYPAAERLIALDHGSFPGPFFQELATVAGVEDWAAALSSQVNLVGQGDPLRLEQASVSRDFFDLFGAHAQRGRPLRPEDFERPDVGVLSAGTWRRVFGADPSVVGRTIDLDGLPVTVVGILNDTFAPPEQLVGRGVDIWRPLDWSSADLQNYGIRVLEIAGRLTPGTRIEVVQQRTDALVGRMASEYRAFQNRDGTPRQVPVVSLADKTVRGVRTGLELLLGAVGLLLLVACANVANLFLARGLGRTREMAVRRSLGASTVTIGAQLLVESLVVGLAGGLLGIFLAWAGIRAFVVLNPTALPRQVSVAVDFQVLAFAIGVSILTSIVFGLLPALRSVRHELAEELSGSGRAATSGRSLSLLRGTLVAGEVAVSLVLVAGAGLLLRSFLSVRAQDPGFSVTDVWTVPLNLPQPDGPAQYLQTMGAILREAQSVPGVLDAAYGLTAPMDRVGGARCCWGVRPTIPGREDDETLDSMVHPVSLDYLTTLGIELVAGRRWTESETKADPVPMVLDASLARELAGTPEAAVGLPVKFQLPPMSGIVVGVAADTRHYGLDQEIGNQLYLPVEQVPFAMPLATLVVHVDPAASRSVPAALRAAIWAAIPSLPVPTVRSMGMAVDASTAGRRFNSVVFGTFAVVALILAAGGLYGTLLYMAGQRRRELGIRLALGASRARIEAQVLRTGVSLAIVGLVIGLAGAWSANRLLESLVWGVGSGDPWALGGATLLLLATAALASWLPARRAGRVDPLETLRVE